LFSRRISTRSAHKDLQKTLTKIFMPGPRREAHKIFIKALLLLEQILQDLEARTSQHPPTKAFIQAPLRHGICKTVKDLHKITRGPLKKEFMRTSTSHKGPLEEYTRIFTQDLWSGPVQDHARTKTGTTVLRETTQN